MTESHVPMIVISGGGGSGVARWVDRCVKSVVEQTLSIDHRLYLQATPEGAKHAYRAVREYGAHRTEIHHDLHRRETALWPWFESLMLPPETVVVDVDADDWLARSDVLEIVAKAYEDPDVWFTYGDFVQWPKPLYPGFRCSPYPDRVKAARSYRRDHWRASHLCTWRVGLAQKVRSGDFFRPDGTLRRPADQARALAMLEMADGRFRYIPDELYVYNCANAYEVTATPEQLKQDREDVAQIRALPVYDRLEERPW